MLKSYTNAGFPGICILNGITTGVCVPVTIEMPASQTTTPALKVGKPVALIDAGAPRIPQT